MLCYFDEEQQRVAGGMGRYHPWSTTMHTPDGRYVDFKADPNAIEATLEDLVNTPGLAARNSIVDFIRWVNRPGGIFETNDFGMRPIKNNESGVCNKTLEQAGRVTILFRNLRDNTDPEAMFNFAKAIQALLIKMDPGWDLACWGWCAWPHLFVELCEGGIEVPEAEGYVVEYLFWAWGDTAGEVKKNMVRAFNNLREALNKFASSVDQPA